MLTKDFAAKVKAEGEEGSGQIKAIVAAYNVDSTKERIAPGSFQKSLDNWKASGEQVPVIWAHQHQDIWAHIGTINDIQETKDGLVADMQLDLDNPTAVQAYKLIKSGRVKNYSFAYDVLDSEYNEKDGVTELKELNLLEAGPCLIGANRASRTLEVKSAIPVTAGPKTTDDGSWDGPKAVAALKSDGDAAYYRSEFAWVDAEGDDTDKSSYKFPHHEVSSDGAVGAANLAACSAGIAVLNGGRGGASIPDADRKGVYDHLAAHIKASGNDVPDLKSDDVENKLVETDEKAGRALSSANLAKIKTALQSIQDALESLEAVTGVNDSDDAASNDEGKAHEDQQHKSDDELGAKAAAEEPEAKSDEVVRSVPAMSLVEAEKKLALDLFASLSNDIR